MEERWADQLNEKNVSGVSVLEIVLQASCGGANLYASTASLLHKKIYLTHSQFTFEHVGGIGTGLFIHPKEII